MDRNFAFLVYEDNTPMRWTLRYKFRKAALVRHFCRDAELRTISYKVHSGLMRKAMTDIIKRWLDTPYG